MIDSPIYSFLKKWGIEHLIYLVDKKDMLGQRSFVETVVKLSQKHIDHSIRVELDLDEFEETPSELRKKATYKEIKNYVFEKYGVKVTTLAISQIKRKCGLEVGDNYNPPKNEKYRQPQCTPEKEEFIMDALRHFKLID